MNEESICPQCGSDKESICIMEVEDYPLIIDQVEMPLKIAVPVERCQDCAFAWTDHQAEEIRAAIYSIYYPENAE